MFDVISFLESNNIEFKTTGKNVTSGWVELSCPFPSCNDRSFHLGINLKSGLFHCWVCGEKGGANKLVKELLDVNYYEAEKIIESFDTNKEFEEEIKSSITKLEIPKEFSYELPQLHRLYLLKRNFDPEYLQNKYKIMACYQQGRFSYRVMTPIFMNKELVNFTGRDVTDLQKTKYLHMHNEESVIPMKNCLYNIDFVKDKVIIVEGVTDVWRIGDGAVATLGVEYTTQQLNLLLEKELSEAYVLYDNDKVGKEKANKLANALSSFVPHVEILSIDAKDPAELSDNDVLELRKDIFKL